MATDATIIVGKLDGSELEASINKLVETVNKKMDEAKTSFDTSIHAMEATLQVFSQKAKTSVSDIKDAFKQLGTTFDDFAKAMQKAAMAAGAMGSGSGSGGSGGASGGGGTGSGSGAAPNTIGALKEEIRLQQKKVDEQVRGTRELQIEVNLHERLKQQLKDETKSSEQRAKGLAKTLMSGAMSKPANTIAQAEAKLRQLEFVANRYQGKGILDTTQWNRLQNEIDKTRKKIEQLKASSPKSLKDVLGMDENSVDAIAKKMQALKHVQIDPKNAAEVRKLGEEYQKLSRKQAELLGKGVQLTHSNNYLAQSFGYIRNRVVYALTLGAVTNFVKQLYDVRGEYELLERSLGILVDSMERGTQVFQELNDMAIKSPFTLIELGSAAKQLAAYNFAEDELVDTTRRLADISSALGVPMERLVYNLGQIKAQGRLNARDARDFANAGLAIVPMLAQMYTETKRFGDQQVTTAQVYDMITKKMVSYNDVLSVIYKVTDEGGKFFDFQAKQAGTLKVQIANLSLAFNNMLNDIGTEHQSALAAPLKLMRTLFANWRDVYKAIQLAIAVLGVFKAEAILTGVYSSLLWVKNGVMGIVAAIRTATSSWQAFKAAVSSNPIGLIATALASLALAYSWSGDEAEDAGEDVERFGESAVKSLKKVDTLVKILNAVDDQSITYKQTLNELNQILEEYGAQTIKETDNLDAVNKKRDQAIELIKRESAERQYANQMAAGNEKYNKRIDEATQKLNKQLKDSKVESWGFIVDNDEVRKHADAISSIVAQIVQENISLITNKTGEEYKKGIDEIYKKFQAGMKTIGIPEETINKVWLDNGLFYHGDIIQNYIKNCKEASDETDRFTKDVNKFHKEGVAAAGSTTTLTQRLQAYERALQKPNDDTHKLYNNISALVRDYAKQHNIDFNVRFKAQVPPSWMNAKDLPELQALAKRFAALAQEYKNGVKVGGGGKDGVFMTQEELFERALMYAEAARIKEDAAATDAAREKEEEKQRKKDEAARRAAEARERAAANRARTEQTRQENEVSKALKDEISLIKEIQSNYEKLRKAGIKNTIAIDVATKGYEGTIKRINDALGKYGISPFDAKDFAGKDINNLLNTLIKQRETLLASGKVKTDSLKDIDVEIQKLNVEARTYNMKKLTDGLNSELGKIKDEYEIALDLEGVPELAGVFADMMGISEDEIQKLPKDFDDVLSKMQSVVDEKMGGNIFALEENLNKSDLEKWMEEHNIAPESELAKSLNSYVDYANKVRKDETKKTVDEWNKLLEKYSEYEYKRMQIIKETEKELALARKRGAGRLVYEAISTKGKRNLADLDFNEFQKSPYWVTATGSLNTLTTSALQMLIDKLEQYKKSAKNLEPKQIDKINKALRNLRKEVRKENPWSIMAIAMDEAIANGDMFRIKMDEVAEEIETLNKISEEQGFLSQEDQQKLKNLIKLWGELEKAEQEASKVSFAEINTALGQYISKAEYITESLSKVADSIGNEDFKRGVELTADIVGNFKAAEEGAEAWGGWWGAIIGGLSDLIPKIVKWANQDYKIVEQIEEQEKKVRSLEQAYKNLQFAVENSLGAEEIYARRQIIINKQQQLAEKQRQLELEKSRKQKNQDANAISQLEGEISDLKNEITELSYDVANMLLGSDIKSAAEDFVSIWVNAWRQGGDTMDALDQKFDNMIDNMIAKALASKVVAKRLQPIFDIIETITGKETDEEMQAKLKEIKDFIGNGNFAKDIDTFLTELYGYLGIGQGVGNGKNLSALQQGIQGITEETAGALEAYMNGVSQQVYLQSDLLTQIRDAVVTLDNEVAMATQTQILLQLQNNYILMQTMAALMNGWSTPSGAGIRVELIN